MSTGSDRFQVYGLIAAAGSGSRMGDKIVSKQLMLLEGIPVIIRSALAFENHQQIKGYRIVASESDLPDLKILFQKYNLKKLIGISTGDITRQLSVLNGLRDLNFDLKRSKSDINENTIVLVHDGARCLVDRDTIARCIETIIDTGQACAAAVPVKDTIKVTRLDSMTIESTPDRSRLWAVQTPQGAVLQDLLKFYEEVTRKGISVTDDLSVMEVSGCQTRVSMGNYMNIKITTPEDLEISRAFLTNLTEN